MCVAGEEASVFVFYLSQIKKLNQKLSESLGESWRTEFYFYLSQIKFYVLCELTKCQGIDKMSERFGKLTKCQYLCRRINRLLMGGD